MIRRALNPVPGTLVRVGAALHLLFGGCAPAPKASPDIRTEVSHHAADPIPARSGRVDLSQDFYVERLTNGIWRHVSSKDLPGLGPFPSNGLLIEARNGLVLVDTPWTPEQARLLIQWSRRTFQREIRDVVVTHAHDDRYGGSRELVAAGASIHATSSTIYRAAASAMPLDARPLAADELVLAGERLRVFFPGAAHAPDNIVVWIPSRRVLFGGCMVRAAGDRSLGNFADADVESWASAIQKVIDLHPDVRIVVPGHGVPGGMELLLHTRDLVAREIADRQAE